MRLETAAVCGSIAKRMILSKKHRKTLNVLMIIVSIIVVLGMLLLYSGILT
jgi:hypothetical protein